MSIELKCVDRGHKDEHWTLDLGEKVVLTGPDGKVVLELDPTEAVSNFRMPDFLQNISYFGIRLEGVIWDFDLHKSDLQRIEQFVDRTLAAGGPAVHREVWIGAAVQVVLGGFGILCGSLATVFSYKEAASKPFGGKYTIYYGLVVAGAVMLYRGFVGLRQYEKLKRLSREPAPREQTAGGLPSLSAPVSIGPQGEGRPVLRPEPRDRTADDAMIGGRRIPVLKIVVAMLLVFAGVEAFVIWRDKRPAPAQAVARNEPAASPSAGVPPQPQVETSFKPTPPSAAQFQELELSAIEGLRECAALVGRYPEIPDTSAPCLQEDIGRMREDLARKMYKSRGDAATLREKMDLEEKYTRITHFVRFCNVLREWTKERAYYGQVVKPGAAERVLLRWQLAPNEYRVIFGDLHTETVSAEELRQLETGQAPASRPKVQPQPQAQPRPAPAIPAALQSQEQAAIEGLRVCASLTGLYPESIQDRGARVDQSLRQLLENAKAKSQSVRSVADPTKYKAEDLANPQLEEINLQQRVMKINQYMGFCVTLRGQQREPVYYGQVVKPGAAERVLLRWRLTPSEYRVIFGDLHVETVTAERLAQLEAAQPPAPSPQIQPYLPAQPRPTSAVPPIPQDEALSAIQALRDCVALVGRYPESLDTGAPCLREVEQLRENLARKLQERRLDGAMMKEKTAFESKYGRIKHLVSFYEGLRERKREPAYYGQIVKSGEAERVLLRWKCWPNAYQVIFGDLRAEGVTGERLAQLEATQAPAPGPQVQPQPQVPVSRPSTVQPPVLQQGERSAIDGLRECAALVGRYPESPDTSAPCFKEDLARLRENAAKEFKRPGADSKTILATVELERKCGQITHFVDFWKLLREWGTEPVYYGQVVKPAAAERVLLRWRLGSNEYRVVYGDLRAETVTADRLAQLEATLPK